MAILGSDGVEMLEKRVRERFQGKELDWQSTVTVNARTLLELIRYYHILTEKCDHEWDVSSPIDTMEICRKCGLCQRCDPCY